MAGLSKDQALTLYECVKAIRPEQGYHIHGIIELLYGHRSEKIVRSINISIQGQDAHTLFSARTGQEIAAMIANVYFNLDIDETEPPFVLGNLDNWHLVIEPY